MLLNPPCPLIMTTMVRCDQLNKYMGDKQMNKVDDSVSEG